MTKREFDAETKHDERGRRIMSASQYRREERKNQRFAVRPAQDKLAERKAGWVLRAALLRARINPDTGARLS